jgi:hypothetical protein
MNKIIGIILVVFCVLSSVAIVYAQATDEGTIREDTSLWTSCKKIFVDFWTGLLTDIKDAIRDVIKQVFTSIHQTLALIIMTWLFKKLENKFSEMQPKITDMVDSHAANAEVSKKQQVGDYIKAVVLSNIKLVEASFFKKINPNDTSDQASVEASKRKMAAALTLIFNDIIKDKMGELIFSGDDKDIHVKHMILNVEKSLNENTDDLHDVETRMNTAMAGNLDNIFSKISSAERVKSLIDVSGAMIPEEYKTAINNNVTALFQSK